MYVCLFTFYTNPKTPTTIIYRNITCCTKKKKPPENKCNEITTLLSALPFSHNNVGSSKLPLFSFPYRIHNQNKSFSPLKQAYKSMYTRAHIHVYSCTCTRTSACLWLFVKRHEYKSFVFFSFFLLTRFACVYFSLLLCACRLVCGCVCLLMTIEKNICFALLVAQQGRKHPINHQLNKYKKKKNKTKYKNLPIVLVSYTRCRRHTRP